MTKSHPYKDLEPRAFWAPAVAQKHMLEVSQLWSAKFPITQASKIATFGSCFAQHFSRALVARGFSWLDAEPAPRGVSPQTSAAFGYGVFSARTGNIYTASLLLQWTRWALGQSAAPEVFWEKDGRVIDPFRPLVEPNGFASVDEMLASRQSTIDGFRHAITTCNLLVFTLGLTESWWDSAASCEYPLCPGTFAGDFDPAIHTFMNQDYAFVLQSLKQAITLIREARKSKPNVLMTVSPVPLTATNSGNHVLVATMDSKSILRAVASKVSKTDPLIDYFPSYEIINSPAYRGAFFEPNMRSVSPHGVDHVMQTFFQGIGYQESPAVQGKGKPRASAGEQAVGAQSEDDIRCEEELLAVFGTDA